MGTDIQHALHTTHQKTSNSNKKAGIMQLLVPAIALLTTFTNANEEPTPMPLIVPFNEDFAPRIFENDIKQHVLIFGKESDAGMADILKSMEPAAEQFREDFLFVWVDADAEQEYGLILDSFGVDREKMPLVKIVKITPSGDEEVPDVLTRFDPETADLNAESMISFCEGVTSGKLIGEPVKSHEDDENMHDEL